MKDKANLPVDQYTSKPLLDREARLKARERIRGMWRDRGASILKETRKARKEWDAQVDEEFKKLR